MSTFELRGVWSGDLKSGGGFIETGGLACEVALPKAFSGSGAGTNPEELLLAAAGSCYMMTLAAVLKARGITAEAIELSSSAEFGTDGKAPQLLRIEHRPRLLGTTADPESLRLAFAAAEAGCTVSRALKVPVLIVPFFRSSEIL